MITGCDNPVDSDQEARKRRFDVLEATSQEEGSPQERREPRQPSAVLKKSCGRADAFGWVACATHPNAFAGTLRSGHLRSGGHRQGDGPSVRQGSPSGAFGRSPELHHERQQPSRSLGQVDEVSWTQTDIKGGAGETGVNVLAACPPASRSPARTALSPRTGSSRTPCAARRGRSVPRRGGSSDVLLAGEHGAQAPQRTVVAGHVLRDAADVAPPAPHRVGRPPARAWSMTARPVRSICASGISWSTTGECRAPVLGPAHGVAEDVTHPHGRRPRPLPRCRTVAQVSARRVGAVTSTSPPSRRNPRRSTGVRGRGSGGL